jgi:hypothetical protein
MNTAPTSLTIASSLVVRLRHLAGRIHGLGPRPLFEMMCELSGSSSALALFETYADIDPDILSRFGGHALPPILKRVK